MSNETGSRSIKTTCPYCGVGCGVIAEIDTQGSVSIRGDDTHPANFGRLCSKGSALAETLDMEGRALEPEIDGSPVSWGAALDKVAEEFSQAIEQYGPDSVAFYVSGQCLTEDYYVANKLMKGFIGSANIDTNSRLCMASSVAGHIRAFGSDTVPGVYEDLELADLIVLTGSNLAWCHPVLYQRIVAAREKRPQMRVVVIDPRRTVTCDIADLYLPLFPDTDVALFLGLFSYLAANNTMDETYIKKSTQGYEQAIEKAAAFDLETTAHETGLETEALERFFRWVSDTEKTVTVYSQGVNQSTSGTDKVNAILNTHLATGRIGKPGMGPFSVTGQPNAMGGREVGGLANQLAAHMKIEDPDHRDLVQSFWRSPTIPTQPGLKATELFEAIEKGQIKALWVMATNPVDSLPNANRVEEALQKCPFVVVSDVLQKTDTTRHANVLLPATAWGEKEGTVTNSERRISRQRKFLESPGNSKPDWWALSQVAKRMGWFDAFDYAGPADIFREHAALSEVQNRGARDFDISAFADISSDAYGQFEPCQWPRSRWSKPEAESGRLFGDGKFFTPSGRANFVAVDVAPREKTGIYILNTGRARDHWHTMTRTGKSARLSAHLAEPYVEIHPDDARERGLEDAELADISNPFGSAIVRVMITDRQQRGVLFVPMHWTDQFASRGRVNKLVGVGNDPYSGQPALKAGEVFIRKFAARWFGFAIMQHKPDPVDMAYWALSKRTGGWQIELAEAADDLDTDRLAETLLGKTSVDQPLSTYCDERSGIYRYASIRNGVMEGALFLARCPVAVSRAWASEQLGKPVTELEILSGRAGADQPDRGALICACLGVGINQITSAIMSGSCSTVADVGDHLKAGTNCGSCLPELKALITSLSTRQAAE